MCNLYRLPTKGWELPDYYKAEDVWRQHLALDKVYASPGKPAPVLVREDGRLVLKRMVWGFPEGKRPRKTKAKEGQSPWVWDKYYTNARNLTLGLWKPWVSDPAHHCLVPFTTFAEPKAAAARGGTDDLNWWFLQPGRAVACFAGIWKPDADHGPVYSFLTCDPNPLVAPLHPKAMPVILQPEDYDRWLSAGFDGAITLQAPFPSQLMALGPNPDHADLEARFPDMTDEDLRGAYRAAKPGSIARERILAEARRRGLGQ
ncbi:SOS response-associated peptidase family protein [Flavisphingomonas formosensis]|uniref:SOS response-associated peptidase family protein n=1 Tax=Flavisphingomonas formosensis TaxID=861534 RepID=UPI0012F9BA0B|nr:SOS response-associated peptidase family protein [Sphingomonas formosensis]